MFHDSYIKKNKHSTQFNFRSVTKKKKQREEMERLPQDLVSRILTKLPAIELSKCKSICKSWLALITNPQFITNYYTIYNNQHEHLLVIRRPFLCGLKTYISHLSWNFNDPKKHIISSEIFNPPYEYNSDHKYWTEIMGPCNGIYFLEGNPNVMMNPSLIQFMVLPQSHFTAPQGFYSFSEYYGFGFDPKTNDYKVVLLKDLWLKETDERQNGYWNVELYSFNSNSWRKLDAEDLPLPFDIWGSSRIYTFVRNCCHWWGFIDGNIGDVVLAFDMVDERFRKIKVPKIEHSNSSGECFKTLVPFDESDTIGVIVYPVKGLEKWFDVWVMNDYSDEGSWMKLYSIGPVPVIYKLVGFYGSNRFLWKDSNERLVLYEAESGNIRYLQVSGKYDSTRAARYMESLVSLQRGNESGYQCFSCSLVHDPLLNLGE
ncbi:putative F-box domain-containing protein [Medicago truncatula]|uniref:Putative F-box domain-containing protein n=1 Tax=Medicago truncatula TaxID=3880 RepID=A0A396GW08_MEDTR|nr:F-box protein CPR1-like [Medicago truncatula]XP_039683569.1 F-box protein CPR1-like [Medicago truncatula]XP_039683570.1 F-box protein CPR1-like [Medicago truncatula]RHN45282.1 putative F-box domain-containing protein [Medicago truncatula]